MPETEEQKADREWQNEQDRKRSGLHVGLYKDPVPDPEQSAGDKFDETAADEERWGE